MKDIQLIRRATCLTAFLAALIMTAPTSSVHAETKAKSVHGMIVKDIDGNDINMEKFDGKVLLIVNVASECGYTKHYKNMVNIHKELKDDGLVVMGFPANNFGAQEPGSNDQIKAFCSSKYGVDFPMFSKVSVKGKDKAPLFQYLTQAENEDFTGDIRWNFEKFLVGKDGKLLRRFRSNVKPDDPKVIAAAKKALK